MPVSLLLALLLAVGINSPLSRTSDAGGKKLVAAWIPWWAKEAGCQAFIRNVTKFDEISPFAYEVSADGSIVDEHGVETAPYLQAIREARRSGVKVLPSVLCGKKDMLHRIIANPQLRAYHVSRLVDLVQTNGYDGVDIDYEDKAPADREAFSAFLKELSRRLHEDNRLLSICVEARTQDHAASSQRYLGAWANDYEMIAQCCDRVRIMGYDQHHPTRKWSLAGPGPVASVQWVNQVLSYTSRYIPRTKIVLGVPTYGYEWKVKFRKGESLYCRVRSHTYQTALSLAEQLKVQPSRDLSFCPSFQYVDPQGIQHQVWYEDGLSMASKIDLAVQHGITGICLFKLDGQHDPEFFNAITLRMSPGSRNLRRVSSTR